MTLSNKEISIANDLQNKCAHDTFMTLMRSVLLADEGAVKLHVAIGGVTGTGAAMAAIMGPDLLDMPTSAMADASLLAMIFAWLCKDPHQTEDKRTAKHTLRRAIAGWEAITNRKFDPSWMRDELREIVQ